MLPNIPIQSIAIATGGFLLGALARTIISVEYSQFRKSQKKETERVENWEESVIDTLSDLKHLERQFQNKQYPDIEGWLEELERVETELMKRADLAPSEINEDLKGELGQLAGLCAGNRMLLSEFYHKSKEKGVEFNKIPLQHEYESVEVEDGEYATDRLLRETCVEVGEEILDRVVTIEKKLKPV